MCEELEETILVRKKQRKRRKKRYIEEKETRVRQAENIFKTHRQQLNEKTIGRVSVLVSEASSVVSIAIAITSIRVLRFD